MNEFWFLFGYNKVTFSENLDQDKRVSTKIQSILRYTVPPDTCKTSYLFIHLLTPFGTKGL